MVPVEPFIDATKRPKPPKWVPRGDRFLRGFFKTVFPEFQNSEKIRNFVKKFSLHFELSRIFLENVFRFFLAQNLIFLKNIIFFLKNQVLGSKKRKTFYKKILDSSKCRENFFTKL